MNQSSVKSGGGGGRFALIDLLRYFAAVLVAVMHWGLELGSERMQSVYNIPVLGFLIKNGGLGVDIFFLISGYVILETAMRKDSLDFIVARFIRLFPGLLISMSIVAIVSPKIIGNYQFSINSYIQSIFLTYQATNTQPMATQLWTLIFEIKFYGAVALVLLVFPKIFKSVNGVLLLLFFWQLSFKLIEFLSEGLTPNQTHFLSLEKNGILFAFGICLNLISRNIHDLSFNRLPTFAVTTFFVYEIVSKNFYGTSSGILILFACLLLLVARELKPSPNTSKIMNYLGLSSYLIYLLHEHLGVYVLMLFQSHISRNLLLLLSSSLLFLTILSIVIALFIEKPIQNFLKTKSKYLRQRRIAD
jgi:peptidoglycan/LPS O-acetylase OafA/YrhL